MSQPTSNFLPRSIAVLASTGLVLLIVLLPDIWSVSEADSTDAIVNTAVPSYSRGTADKPTARLQHELEKRGYLTDEQIPADIHARSLQYARTLTSDLDLRWAAMAKGSGDEVTYLNTDWQRRGPFNIGGRTRALAIDISDERRILAGGVSGGLWLSEDDGQSWSKRTSPADLQSITCIAQDKREGRTQTWYYGTGEFRGNSADGQGAPYRGDGLFKSDNGGRTWSQIESTKAGSLTVTDSFFDYVWNVAVDNSRTDQDIVYVAGFGGILRSADGGQSWDVVLGDLDDGGAYTDVYVNELGDVYAVLSTGLDGGVWRSDDGLDWLDVTPSNWPAAVQRTVIGPTPFYDEMFLFSRTPGRGTNSHSLFKFIDRTEGVGENIWEDRSSSLPREGDFGTINSQFNYNMTIAVHPEDDFVVYVGGRNIYRTENGFEDNQETTWMGGYNPNPSEEEFRYPNHHPDQHALVFYPSDPDRMLSGCDGGVFRTDANRADEVEWEPLNKGYFTTQFYSIAIEPQTAGDPYILGGTQDNGSLLGDSFDANQDWAEVLGGDGSFCAISAGREIYYVSSQNGQLHYLRLDEDGTRLQRTRMNPPQIEDNEYVFINPFAIDPNNGRILYMVTRWALWRNNPSGQPSGVIVEWDKLNNSTGNEGRITSVVVSKEPANRVYYGTNRSEVYRIDNADVGDPQVVNVSGDLADYSPFGFVNCIAVDPTDADKAIAVMSNYRVESVFYTENGGSSWTPISGNLEEDGDASGDGPSVSWAGIMPTEFGTAYFVGTSVGLFATTILEGDETSWVQQGEELIGNVVVDMVVTRPADRLVAIATHGNGMYSATLDEVFFALPATSAGSLETTNFGAITISPTPMQASGNLQFSLERAAACTVEILDRQGRTVQTLLKASFLESGEHSLQIDARDMDGRHLAAGSYYVRLRAGDNVQFGKLVIVK